MRTANPVLFVCIVISNAETNAQTGWYLGANIMIGKDYEWSTERNERADSYVYCGMMMVRLPENTSWWPVLI